MKNNSVKNVVAVGIGAALFVILGMVNIPLFGNTSVSLQYAVQALFSVIYGPIAGFLMGLIGHTVKDMFAGYGVWWSWVIPSALIGLGLGAFRKFYPAQKGDFGLKQILIFNVVQVAVNYLAWGLIAPWGDILIYNEPANKVFTQGVIAGLSNALTIGIGGTILLAVYAKNRTKAASLSKD